MKTIIFVRHGKSSWDYQVSDKDRPLKERGINDAHLVSAELKKLQLTTDFCYSSPANRALHTCMIFLRNLNYDFNKFQLSDALYDFSGQSVQRFLTGLNNSLDTVMVFGHNYAFTSLVNMLGDTYIENVPTTGMAIIQMDIDKWEDMDKGRTLHLVTPKQLK